MYNIDYNYFKDKNLLVISPRFPPKEGFPRNVFVKEQVDEVKKYFNRVIVIATSPYIPKFISKFMQPKRRHEALMKDYSYDNVEVYYTKDLVLPFDFHKRKWGEMAFKKSIKILEKIKFKPDIIHAHFTWPSGYAAVKLAKKYGVPSIITIHENRDWFLEEYNSKNEKVYWTWRNADALIRVNKGDIPLLKKFNSRVFHIPNGFDPKRLPIMNKEEARAFLEIPSRYKVIFSLGHLVERKGFQYLIDAISLVLKERDDVMCYIGGNGPFKDRLQKQINELGLQEHVKLLGFVPDEKLKYWMNAADLFVLPSLSEGNPTVMFEALGVGLPFVGTAVGGTPEIINSEDYGFLCPSKDPECLAEKILEALEKDWDRKKIIEYAKQFTWENIAYKIIEIYQIICK